MRLNIVEPPRVIRVKIKMYSQNTWFATAPNPRRLTPEKLVGELNEISKRRNLGSVYELATEDEYQRSRK